MNRYLNTYDTYESRLQSLLDDGYDFMEASEIASDEDLFNQEVFGELENINSSIRLNKKMADDQREKENFTQYIRKEENQTLLTILFFRLNFYICFFLNICTLRRCKKWLK